MNSEFIALPKIWVVWLKRSVQPFIRVMGCPVSENVHIYIEVNTNSLVENFQQRLVISCDQAYKLIAQIEAAVDLVKKDAA